MFAAEKTDIMGRFAARAENTRLKQMHPHWQKHRAGPETASSPSKMEILLDGPSPEQLALQVPVHLLDPWKALKFVQMHYAVMIKSNEPASLNVKISA